MENNIIIELKIELLNSTEMNRDFYGKPGVWSLYGRKSNEDWQCLEVAKTVNIYNEIMSAIYILITSDDDICMKCNETYKAKKRFGDNSAEFYIHKCKMCEHVSSLRTKTWKRNPRYIDKYKDILKQNYAELRFLCIDISDNMRYDDKRRAVEQQYAINNKALYWWG